jgi:hypothetical protein
MISGAYTNLDPLLMNAFNTVNLAAACILTSVEHAKTLGIPEEKWVYVLGGAGTSESSNCRFLLLWLTDMQTNLSHPQCGSLGTTKLLL